MPHHPTQFFYIFCIIMHHLPPLEVEVDENIAIFQENMSLVTCGQTFTDLPSGRDCFHCFSTIIDQLLIPESFRCVCV